MLYYFTFNLLQNQDQPLQYNMYHILSTDNILKDLYKNYLHHNCCFILHILHTFNSLIISKVQNMKLHLRHLFPVKSQQQTVDTILKRSD